MNANPSDELAHLRERLATCEQKLSAALILLPDSLPIAELRLKRDEVRAILSALTHAHIHIKTLLARASDRASPHFADAQAFVTSLERNEIFRAHVKHRAESRC